MSTYLISDIHGHLKLFKDMLEKIEFDYKTDELYLLGDYVDWGPDSIETILFVMELDKKYDNIHVLIGNHDLMFLTQAEKHKKNPRFQDCNWLYNNRGIETFEQFLKLDTKIQDDLIAYLDNLEYRFDVCVKDKKYILAHACPVEFFEYDENISEELNEYYRQKLRYDAVWERVIRYTWDVIFWFGEEGNYDNFICGHTITPNYKIVNTPGYIDIDCGAKIINHEEFGVSSKYASLSCLRLDDMKEYYVKY